MKKRLSKILWYGEELPNPATTPDDLDGLHKGELFLHLKDDGVTLWSLSADGRVVEISGGGDGDLSQYLLKSIWDRVWEIKTDSQGNEYILGKMPVAVKGGLTTFADNGEADIPSIYDGLPIDNQTLYWEEETDENGEVVRVLKSAGGTGGGGEADSVHWDNVAGKPSFATVATSGQYSDLKGLPDLSEYVGADELKKYALLDGDNTFTKENNFTGGLKVNGRPIVYKDGYWKLEGDLLVTGGIASFSNDTQYKPSTVMDALVLDNQTLDINEQGQLYAKGGASSNVEIVDALPSTAKPNTLYVVV